MSGPGLIWLDVTDTTAERFEELIDRFLGDNDDEQVSNLCTWLEMTMPKDDGWRLHGRYTTPYVGRVEKIE